MLSSVLRMTSGLGFSIPDINEYSEEELISLLDTGIELLGMIRDGDTDTDDPRAREIYRQLIGS
jgi:hypothetical protein